MDKITDMISLYDAIHLLFLNVQDLTSTVFLIKEGILYSDAVASTSTCGLNIIYNILDETTEKIEQILSGCKEIEKIDEEKM